MNELKVYRSLRRPSVHQHFQTSTPLKSLGQLSSKFHMETLGRGNDSLFLVTLPIWPPRPYMVKKTFKNLLLWNQRADDIETWYAALGMLDLPSLFKSLSSVDLDLLNVKVKFAS